MSNPTEGADESVHNGETETEDRASRLRDLIAGESKVNDECLTDFVPGADLGVEPAEITDVPFRYACPTYDGYSTWIEFANELDAMMVQLADACTGENPYAPGQVLDLDTGQDYRSLVEVTLVPEDTYQMALKVLRRLQAGEAVMDALEAEGYEEDDDIVSENSSALALDDIDNNVIDFCANVLLRRVGSQIVWRDAQRILVDSGEWQLETY